MLLSTLEYAAYLSYTPRGTTEEAERSKKIMHFIKQERLVSYQSNPAIPMSEFIAKSLKDELEKLPFANFFGEDVSLVPIPKTSLMKEGTLWVPQRLVKAFSKFNLGKEFDCLIRTREFPKAAFAKPSDRPKAIDHYQTIDVQKGLETPRRILLVDDVTTRGATLLGSASRLHEAFPNVPIRAFAVLRTISNAEEFSSINSPIVDKIILKPDGNTQRYP